METLGAGYTGGHSESTESMNHFSSPKTNYNISSIYYEEILPLTPMAGRNLTQINFQIDANPSFTGKWFLAIISLLFWNLAY